MRHENGADPHLRPAQVGPRNRAARRQRIIDSAIRLAAKPGSQRIDIRRIAAESGLAVNTVYNYFNSKERLVLEVVAEEIDSLRARLADDPARGTSALERVTDVLGSANASLQSQQELTLMMVRVLGSARAENADLVRRVQAAMTVIITEAMHTGEPTARERAIARVLQQVWFSSLVGWAGGVDDFGRVQADLEAAAVAMLGEVP